MEITRGQALSTSNFCGEPGDGLSCEVYPDCTAFATQADCETNASYFLNGASVCTWNGASCDPDCAAISDSASCDAQTTCAWSTDLSSCLVDRPTTRWEQALDAVEQITTGYGARLRFGLSTFPADCGATQCGLHGNWYSCNAQSCVDCTAFAGDPYACRADNSCYYSGVCLNSTNFQPGQPDVPVGDGTGGTILGQLANIFPGGGTPTGPTLRDIRDNRASFGVTEGINCGAFTQDTTCVDSRCYWDGAACVSHCLDPLNQSSAVCGTLTDCVWDEPSTSCLKQQDVGDYVLLVTDGEANGDDDCATATDSAACTAVGEQCSWTGTKCQMGASSTWWPDQVNAALDDLQALAPTVKTYVVGFALEGVSQNLNCHATHGGTARTDTCAGVDETTCDNSACSVLSSQAQCGSLPQCSWTGSACEPNACYYDAGDAATLLTALNDIVGTVALCSITVDGVRSSDATALSLLHIYLDWGGGTMEELLRGATTWSWDLSDTYVRVNFASAACDVIKSGVAEPLAVLGCGGISG